ncbi:MAG: hypothetical protein KTR29_03245 [Rhodothermaceae bacterium]|nr:hypothetical protein [Rhodothermaceae bacterium]
MSTSYIPISCSYYDRLEAWAVRREIVTINYTNSEDGEPQSIQGVIVDLYSKEKAEYLRLNTGETIRLDALQSVNNIPLPSESSCNL